jgi:2,3-bisphosphoglycerate-independent phosphoglycerate mutase
MLKSLKKNPRWQGRRGPVVLMIMDGVGYGRQPEGDAVAAAHTPNLDWLHAHCPHTRLRAHGTAVGLPSDEDMGNSEVGHNAIGCGRVFSQGAMLVNQAIAEGRLFAGETWQALIENCRQNGSTLHFLGLFSDGNVHSHLDHLKAMLVEAKRAGVGRVRIHTLLDGRDVPATSALDYVLPFEAFLAELNADGKTDFRLASGGGRMVVTMDRYGANWDMVRKGWDIHVHGKGRGFATTQEAIETLRRETSAIDQDLPPWVIVDAQGQPVGPVRDGDSVVFFNFRGDRALEITAAFEDEAFDKFDRSPRPQVMYAGMMQYDGDLLAPKRFLVTPPAIDRTLGEFLCASGVPSLAISETQKYGHVTYFFNGNRTGKFNDALETYVEITSDIVPFEQRPWMKGAEITDAVVAAIHGGAYRFIRMNYPNGDMVGHTGVYPAALCAVAALDLCLGRVMQAVREAGGILLVSADHGNCDDMFEHDKKTGAVLRHADGSPKAKTAHSLNPVPCLIFDPENQGEYETELRPGLGISSLAATTMVLLGFQPPDDYDPAILQFLD